MRNRNLFVFLSLLSMPTGYLCAAAESAEGRARREAQEVADRALITQALATDASGFSEDDMQHAKAQSLGLDDTEEKVKEESAGRVEARAANVPITMGDFQNANKEQYTQNAATETKKPTTKRGQSLVGIIARDTVLYENIAELIENTVAMIPSDTVLPKEIADLIEYYKRPRMQEGTIKVEGEVHSIALSPDSYIIASAVENNICLYDTKTGTLVKMLKGHMQDMQAFTSVTFSPDGKYIASGADDETVCIWDVEIGVCIKVLKHDKNVTSVVFSPDGKHIASGSSDSMVRIWNVVTGECLKILQGHSDQVNSVAFSPDGQYIVSGSTDETVRIWHVATGKCLKTLQGHSDPVNSVAFSPDGRYIASGSGPTDNSIRIWSVVTGECLKTLWGHDQMVNSVSFSPDGQQVVSGSFDGMVRIWNIAAILATRHTLGLF